jgi:hypothetical protein
MKVRYTETALAEFDEICSWRSWWNDFNTAYFTNLKKAT